MLGPLLVLVTTLAADEPGFGGNDPAPADVPSDDACVIKGDDGVWRSCADAIAAKGKKGDDAPPPDDPETAALKKRMREAEAAQAAAAAVPPKKTKLEIDLEKARLDPTLPLLALRIDVARAQQDIEDLEKKGVGGPVKDDALARLAEAQSIDDDVERIALHRMDVCMQRHGKKSVLKNFRMTAGGPVLLTVPEMMRALPLVDPVGCERVFAIDDKVVARVKRAHEIQHTLATVDFGYARLDERKKLEHELAAVNEELKKDAVPALSAPGVRDPH